MAGFSAESIAKSQATKKAKKEAKLLESQQSSPSKVGSSTGNMNIDNNVLNLAAIPSPLQTEYKITGSSIATSQLKQMVSNEDKSIWMRGFEIALRNQEVRAKNAIPPAIVLADAILDAYKARFK